MPDLTDQLREFVKNLNPALSFDIAQTPDQDSYDLIVGFRAKGVHRLTGQQIDTPEVLAREVADLVRDVEDHLTNALAKQIKTERDERDREWTRQVMMLLMGNGVGYNEAEEIIKLMKERLK